MFIQSANTHPVVDEAAGDMKDAVKDLTDTLEEAASETGAVTGLVESISKAMNEVRFYYVRRYYNNVFIVQENSQFEVGIDDYNDRLSVIY